MVLAAIRMPCILWGLVYVLTLLVPSPSALRMLLVVCERPGAASFLKFNPDRHQMFQTS